MDKLKLKSYILLMTYDLHRIIERNTNNLKEYLKKESDPMNEQILLLLKEIGTTPIDIYSWSLDWDELCSKLILMIKPIFREPLIESNNMMALLNKWYIEPEGIDLKTLTNRLAYIITKYPNLLWLFQIIYDNYKDFKKYHLDIEIGSEKFNEIILKKINKGGSALTSERTHRDIQRYFNDSKKKENKTYEFVMNNLPFNLLKDINTSNENKISLFFQRGLAREMLVYLNFTKMSVTQKQYFLGFSFLLCRFIYTEDEFIQMKLAKEQYYEFIPRDYEDFLRTEGYNVYKSL